MYLFIYFAIYSAIYFAIYLFVFLLFFWQFLHGINDGHEITLELPKMNIMWSLIDYNVIPELIMWSLRWL